MNSNSKIGIFDSGLGGLSVLNTIRSLLPNESFIYIGDSGNAPYGTKSKEEVLRLSTAICDELVASDVKAIVIACNTATSAAVTQLREHYSIPIIGMEPAIKPALKQTEGQVFVLATEMTLKEEKFQKLVESVDEEHRIIKIPAPEWVTCVEEHLEDQNYIMECVSTFLEQHCPNAQNIVLGCTHYIFLKPQIEAFFKGKIEIFDGNMGTALQLKNSLDGLGLLKNDGPAEGTVEIRNTKSEQYVAKSVQLIAQLRK